MIELFFSKTPCFHDNKKMSNLSKCWQFYSSMFIIYMLWHDDQSIFLSFSFVKCKENHKTYWLVNHSINDFKRCLIIAQSAVY